MSLGSSRRQLDGAIWRAPTPREVEAELAFHVEMLTRELLAAGHPPEAAAAEVRRRFGDLDRIGDTAATNRRNPSTSSRSWRRPAGVSL